MPLNPDSPLAHLMRAPVLPGRVVWLGMRSARRAPLCAVERAEALAGRGFAADHYGREGGSRQVTLIAAESLAAIASHLGRDTVSPLELRRNIVTAGINLHALKSRRFRVGDAILEASGECHPCSRMEDILGVGGYNAVRGHGGITARVVASGEMAIYDPLHEALHASLQSLIAPLP